MIDLSKMKNQELAEYYKEVAYKDDKKSVRKAQIVAKEIANRFVKEWGKRQKEEKIFVPNEEREDTQDISLKELGLSGNEFDFLD